MPDQFKDLNPLLHSRLRLAVISLLISLDRADFTYLQEKTEATPGNLSVQLDKLEKAGYIAVKKSFKGKRPNTAVRITPKGVAAFEEYVNAMQTYLGK